MKWTFEGLASEVSNPPPREVTVEAPDEAEARHRAIVARWGSRAPNIGPDLITGKYKGRGLTLIRKG